MRSPFPGMDPYLEHPTLWPDVHNRLITAISDVLAPQVAPRYFVGLERRAFKLTAEDVFLIGRPDIALVPLPPFEPERPVGGPREATTAVLEVELPMSDEVQESYLEVREVTTGVLVTVLELLSPANKLHADGRRQYEVKRSEILASRTSLVEIDLLRAGNPMPVLGVSRRNGYAVIVSRGWRRPRAQLYAFGLRGPIPTIPVPLRPGEEEPSVDLNAVVHDVYGRARFDLRLDYDQPPVPPLTSEDADWARGLGRG